MTEIQKQEAIFGEQETDEISGHKILSFKEEMREMPGVLRMTIYMSIACLLLLCLQCIFIMPLILFKYGWGYGGAYVQ